MLNINYYFGFALHTRTIVLTPYLSGLRLNLEGLDKQ